MTILNSIALQAISFYQRFISPLLGNCCRYYPSCSNYAQWCFRHHPFHVALFKSIWRILRCNPLARGYFDTPWPNSKVKTYRKPQK